MSVPKSTPRTGPRIMLILAAIAALCVLTCVGFCGYVVYLEEVIEPKRRAADPEYAKRQDEEHAKRDAQREAAREASRARREQQAQRDLDAQRQAQEEVAALLERELEAARAEGYVERLKLAPPKHDDPLAAHTERGLKLREGRHADMAYGKTYEVFKSEPLSDFCLVVDLWDFYVDSEERVELEVGVRMAQDSAGVSMSYEEVRSRRGDDTRGYLLSRPDRKMIGPARVRGGEPTRRVFRLLVRGGAVRVWVNGYEQLLGKPLSSMSRSGYPTWSAEKLRAASPVELFVRFHTLSKDNPFQREASVTIGSVHLFWPP